MTLDVPQHIFETMLGQIAGSATAWDLLAVVVAIALLRLSRHGGMWCYAVATLPGTFTHELAHFTTALFLLARPTLPSLRPVKTERGWKLGEVRFRAGKLRSGFIGVAPILLAPLAWLWAQVFLATTNGLLYVLNVWIVAALLTACVPSKTDLKIAAPGLIFMGAAVAVGWVLIHR